MSVVSSSTTKVTPKKGKALPTVGQATQGLMAAVMEDAIEEINTLLRENTSKILPALKIIRSDDLVPKQVEEAERCDEKPFHNSYTKLQRLPKEFARELLSAEADKSDITIEIFEQLERGTEGSTRAAFYYAHQVVPAIAWPKFALDKGVFRATFKARHEECGSLMKTMPLITRGDKLCIDWNSWGVYKLLPDGKVAKTQVQHVKLNKTANLPITIGAEDEYLIQNNWDDMRAQLKYKTLLTPILNMFDASFKHEVEGLCRVGEALQRLANAAEADRLKNMPEVDREGHRGIQPLTAANLAKIEEGNEAGEKKGSDPEGDLEGDAVPSHDAAPTVKRRRQVGKTPGSKA